MKGLNSFALTDTATLELDGPDGTPACVTLDESDIDPETGKPRQHQITIELLRTDSGDVQKLGRRHKNERLRKASRKRGRMDLKQEDFDEEALTIAVFCTRSWKNFFNADDSPMACDAATVRQLYSDPQYSWLTDQVHAFINEPEHFVGNSSTS